MKGYSLQSRGKTKELFQIEEDTGGLITKYSMCSWIGSWTRKERETLLRYSIKFECVCGLPLCYISVDFLVERVVWCYCSNVPLFWEIHTGVFRRGMKNHVMKRYTHTFSVELKLFSDTNKTKHPFLIINVIFWLSFLSIYRLLHFATLVEWFIQ